MGIIYYLTFLGLFIILLTLLIQWFVASKTKASQAGAIPGKIPENLSHESFVFRAHRTFMNSLENLPLMLGTIFMAVLIGANSFWTGIFVWVFAIARILHMVLYYAISTKQNPSPRTWFFMIGLLANVALLALCGITLLS
ncbi:MAPEG family protein [Methylophaga sp. UBA2689]|uniref:MAPEG family protein n=1 Tax=Methylophaga sp. UBA2689 TaxID=1946878 RepID=UPI0025F51E67|nr:MAPEG family protein [Methylophaga sp. UBA2689]|tara:strand:+ start:1706 stop:2125 length:420 start_codon:yes stop_codon:yes gene_type:complete